ncbi:hypothetical protein SAMN04489722_1022 [Algibacter lectus]|uniref:PIN-like domain-containing protein n=1 Tax=Algibacter lectus TaxID=221126 RepID=UPI0008EFE623|nr:PIN-like domain-containing protein [Algibacter lectus]SFC22180.1 hypothetical protein SAMN04489722_1022 [Algibacter lectus]
MKYNIYELTDSKEKNMWEDSFIVFDSSALLDFYFLPKNTRENIFNNLFNIKLKDRLWSPAHVKYEYLKNRKRIISKPINEKYKPLKTETLKDIKNSINTIGKKIEDLKRRTSNDDKHPFLKQNKIEDFFKSFNSLKEDSIEFEKDINNQIDDIEKEINDLHSNDDVLNAFESSFKIGNDYNFNEIIEITKEGKHRYEFSIPPGYEDLKDKKGTQIFGDLIIWKQILDFSKENKKPIIFICNDLKEDWCILEKENKRIKSPRKELIKEIYDNSGVEFWMYNQAQFLHNANKYLGTEIEEENIDLLSNFINEKDDDEKKSNKTLDLSKELEKLKLILKSETKYVENYRKYVDDLYSVTADDFAHNNAIELSMLEDNLTELQEKISELEQEKIRLSGK